MNPYFEAWLATQEPIIELALEPAAALGYGLDTSCAFDFQPDFGVVTGRQLLAEAAIRRLCTARGGLIDEPDYGLALVSLLNSGRTVGDVNSIEERIRAELLKDPRLTDVSVSVTGSVLESSEARIRIVLTPADESGPFELVISYGTTEPMNSQPFVFRVSDAT
jgi:hypothetical protein